MAQAPFLEGWNLAESQRGDRQARELQTVGVLARLQQQQMLMQKAQRQQQMEQQYRGALAQLGPDATEADILKAIRPYASPDKLISAVQGSADRTAQRQDRMALGREQIEARLYTSAQAIAARIEEAKQRGIDRKELQLMQMEGRRELAQLAASLRQPREEPAPIVQTDDQGNTRLYDRRGNLIRDLGKTGKPSIANLKEQQAKRKLDSDLAAVIPNLEAISKDGGLIDQSTGSGAGALVDVAAGFVGSATPGSIAVGELKPLVDPILKLVPRFEGPQSDKDTASYKEAAGDLANPAVPNARKKAAAKTILDIYKKRRAQFSTTDYEAEVGSSAPAAAPQTRVVDW